MPNNIKTVREIRINPVIPSESVVISTARGNRPKAAEKRLQRDTSTHKEHCPFCRGNESMTPPTLLSLPDDNNWTVRIVENLYPVLGEDANESGFNMGLQQAIEGYGRHEVVIDHNNHGIAIHEMEIKHLHALLKTYRQRMQQLYQEDPLLKYVLIFKNFGASAGASIKHTHSQIIALPVIPENVYNELTHSHAYHQKHGNCIFCKLIDEAISFEATIYDKDSGEIRRTINPGDYIVERGEHFIAIKPFASRFEWEVHILPLNHESNFIDTDEVKLKDFATVLKNTMSRLDKVLGGVQYNYFLHSEPHTNDKINYKASYHWHLEICPRTSIPSGFELGSGLSVNTISPEDAAQRLRDVVLQKNN